MKKKPSEVSSYSHLPKLEFFKEMYKNNNQSVPQSDSLCDTSTKCQNYIQTNFEILKWHPNAPLIIFLPFRVTKKFRLQETIQESN